MTENIPRVIPKGLGVQISTQSWQLPPMFQWLQQAGNISDAEMRRTFNCGVGMIVVVDKAQVAAAKAVDSGLFELGQIVEGKGVTYV
jgi:phosphoribosylformylglycinamidine cyclo-ligase